MSDEATIDLRLNGQAHRVAIQPDSFLIDVLRDQLGAREVKEACDEGECGSCTVLVDGMAVDSCIFLAGQIDGCDVATVASGTQQPRIAALQRAFVEEGAVQCGFCTPGFVMAAAELLEHTPSPSEAEVREGLAGNLCRCTGYNNIVAAVSAAAKWEGTDGER
jgi:aerobic carbon-monoxide dehydrogenase small subunit